MTQLIKYSWIGQQPHFVMLHDGQFTRFPLLDATFSCTISAPTCIGCFRGSKHVPCPDKRLVTDDRQCASCRLTDDYFYCIRCTGDICLNLRKRTECEANHYFLYLAAFDGLLKVGISYEYRALERFVEQGADFAAKIARVQDGKIVRQIEQQLRSELQIVDRLTGEQKQAALMGDPNRAVANIFRALATLRSGSFAPLLMRPEIYDLRAHYNLHRVTRRPSALAISDGMALSGRILAAKGNILVIDTGDACVSLNAHRLIGRTFDNFQCVPAAAPLVA